MTPTELVVRKSILVRCDVERAFDVFTRGISEWWPLRTHSLGHERAVRAVLEGRVGGRLYEVWDDGSERPWGTITSWEPPHRLAVSWRVNPEAPAATEWEARFSAEGAATRLDLLHRGFELLGDAALDSHASYLRGWDTVLSALPEAAARA